MITTKPLAQLGMLFLGISITISSCTIVSFDGPMPSREGSTNEFPRELQGTWYNDEGDQITIDGIELDAGDFSSSLSDGCLLIEQGNWYFLNLEEDGYWMVYSAHLKDENTLHLYWFDGDDEVLRERLESRHKAEYFYDSDGDVERVHFDISEKQFNKLLKDEVFSEMGTYYRK